MKIKRLNFVGLQLNNTGMIDHLLGNGAVKNIQKGTVKVPTTEIPIIYSTRSKFFPIKEEVVVTLALNSDEILLLEDSAQSDSIIALHNVEGEIEKWAKITGASNIETKAVPAPYKLPDPILIRALISLDSINKTIMLHDGDKDRIATYVRTLLDYNIPLDESEIECYLFKTMNWSKEAIDVVVKIFTTMKNGGRVQYKSMGKSADIYNKWV